jgi:hypothetical protein
VVGGEAGAVRELVERCRAAAQFVLGGEDVDDRRADLGERGQVL